MLAALVLSLLSLIVPVRPRLRGQTVAKPTTTKKEEDFHLPLSVPLAVLFSNEFLRDLSRLWSLRDIAPDPNNLPWIEKN